MIFPIPLLRPLQQYSPALIANYTYDLVKEFNSFYQQVSILGEEDEQIKIFRVLLSAKVASVIKTEFWPVGHQGTGKDVTKKTAHKAVSSYINNKENYFSEL